MKKNKAAQSLQRLSVTAQIKKYGGKDKYREEMKRRNTLRNKPKQPVDKPLA